MDLAFSAPKTNPWTEQGGEVFSSLEQSFFAFANRTCGKILVVTDKTAYARLAFAVRHPRSLCVVLEAEDALPLFSFSDAGAVFAAGGDFVLRAARMFSALNRLPLLLAPSDAGLCGAIDRAAVLVDGNRANFPLAEGELCLDLALLKPSLAEGYARLLLARLAVLEARAAALLLIRPSDFADEMLSALSVLDKDCGAEDIVRANFSLRRLESEGAPTGEGTVLAELHHGEARRIRAFCELFALYAAFFRRGHPRKYTVPDYSARAKKAGTTVSLPPTAEDFAQTIFNFERRRADLSRLLEPVERGYSRYLRTYSRLSGKAIVKKRDLSVLQYLPEHCPEGLTALIRDFGLMEWSS